MPKAGSTGINPKFLFVLKMSFSFTHKAPKISESQTPEDSLEGNPDSRARMDGCSGSPPTVRRLLGPGSGQNYPQDDIYSFSTRPSLWTPADSRALGPKCLVSVGLWPGLLGL